MFYFCHIPKTSGDSINSEIYKVQSKVNGKQLNTIDFAPNTSFEEIEYLSKKPIDGIIGHFAANPFSVFDIDFSFSIIREPFSRLLSVYKYMHRDFYPHLHNKKLCMDFMRGDYASHNPPRQDPGFDDVANVQSSYLSKKIEKSNEGHLVIGGPDSLADVLEIIDSRGIIIHTMEARSMLIDKINNYFIPRFGMGISGDVHTNYSSETLIDFSDSEILEVQERNKIDYELYVSIKNKETKDLL